LYKQEDDNKLQQSAKHSKILATYFILSHRFQTFSQLFRASTVSLVPCNSVHTCVHFYINVMFSTFEDKIMMMMTVVVVVVVIWFSEQRKENAGDS